MKAYVGVTDFEWFNLLSSLPDLEEVNFWQPGGNRIFSAIEPNELFLFKLHSPRDFIVGGGFFAHATILPVSLAWETFGRSNGADSLPQMRSRIEQYRRATPLPHEDYKIGCILLSQPFFWNEERWIPVPQDWKPNIVQGKGYNLLIEPGLSLYRAVQERIAENHMAETELRVIAEPKAKYGPPIEILPRLGQGGFRIVVTDAYKRKCAVSGEKVLPVLIAAHIRPYANGGDHQPNNGILLRSDLHTLLDRGYVTIAPDYKLEVSKHIKEDYENGHEYYAFQGSQIHLPTPMTMKPSPKNLAWHNENVYLG